MNDNYNNFYSFPMTLAPVAKLYYFVNTALYIRYTLVPSVSIYVIIPMKTCVQALVTAV